MTGEGGEGQEVKGEEGGNEGGEGGEDRMDAEGDGVEKGGGSKLGAEQDGKGKVAAEEGGGCTLPKKVRGQVGRDTAVSKVLVRRVDTPS